MIDQIANEKVFARIIFERDTMIEAMIKQIETMQVELRDLRQFKEGVSDE